jgi:hypothetical protein
MSEDLVPGSFRFQQIKATWQTPQFAGKDIATIGCEIKALFTGIVDKYDAYGFKGVLAHEIGATGNHHIQAFLTFERRVKTSNARIALSLKGFDNPHVEVIPDPRVVLNKYRSFLYCLKEIDTPRAYVTNVDTSELVVMWNHVKSHDPSFIAKTFTTVPMILNIDDSGRQPVECFSIPEFSRSASIASTASSLTGCQDNDLVARELNRGLRDVKNGLSVEAAMNRLQSSIPPYYYVNSDKIHKIYMRALPAMKQCRISADQIKFDIADPAILKWFDHPNLVEPTCLYVYGKSKIGKTQYVAHLCEREGKTYYLANNINSLRSMPASVDYILFDEFAFDQSSENMISLLDCESERDIRVLYGVVRLKPGVRKIFCSNRNIDQQFARLVDLCEDQKDAIMRRITYVNQVGSLRVKDYESQPERIQPPELSLKRTYCQAFEDNS